MTDIQGRLAVVTGGASGIGRGLAVALRERGATVIIADIDQVQVERAADEIDAIPYRVDVSSEADVQRLAEQVRAEHGPAGLLFNNAGVASTAPLEAMTDSDWEWLLGVNFSGMTHGVRAFLPHLREAGGGHIINTGSLSGLRADAGSGGYGVTKFAITAYTEVLADEFAGSGIGVTLFLPGPVRTKLGSSSRNRPAVSRGALHDVDLTQRDELGLRWIEPGEAAEVVLRAVETDARYAVTHPDWLPRIAERHRAIEQGFLARSRG